MRRSTALTATVALFLVGVLVGVAATHAFYLSRMREPGGLAAIGLRLLSWELRWRLHLTPAQRAEVDHILADTRGEGLELRREMVPRVLELMHRSRDRIVAILDPEQRATFLGFNRRHQKLIESFALPPEKGKPAPAPPAVDPAPAPPAPTSSPGTASSTPPRR